MSSQDRFEPEIVAFTCTYCAYAAADLAGIMRLQYPHNIKIIKLPCSGTVIVAGCLEGGCHFLEGNIRARKRVERAKVILDDIGVGGERLEMFNMSSSEGPRFAEVAREITERIKELGPSPLKGAGYDYSEAKTT
jgi:F420-non-reducing hydrogenase iron-sulfur subunit